MQGLAFGTSSPPATTPASNNGTAEAKIFTRNMGTPLTTTAVKPLMVPEA
jgi:hypothetical protein